MKLVYGWHTLFKARTTLKGDEYGSLTWHLASHFLSVLCPINDLRLSFSPQLKKRTMERKQASSLLSSVGKSLGLGKSNGDCNGHANGDTSRDGTLTNGQKGEFDDLISALRTGDVFGDDVAKFKRSRKSSKASHKGRDSPPRSGICREDSRERQKNWGDESVWSLRILDFVLTRV